MTVAIVGNDAIGFIERDVDGMFRFLKNAIHPHTPTMIYTTDGGGAMQLARMMAEAKKIPLTVFGAEDRVTYLLPRNAVKRAIEAAEFTLIVRMVDDVPWMSRYCVERGRLFQEKVINPDG